MKRLIRWVWHWPKWLASALTLLLILWLTLAPRPVGDMDVPLFPGIDKVVHAIMFGWLALMLIMDSEKKWGHHGAVRHLGLKGAAACAVVATIIGISIEGLQVVMHLGRGYEPLDILADAAGTLVVLSIFAMRRAYWQGHGHH